MAVLLGIVAANVRPLPQQYAEGVAFAGRRILRVGIALLGMQLSVRAVADIGVGALLAVVAVVVCTIVGTLAIARLLGLSEDFGILMGVGYGICGASAIAAAKSQTRASREEVSYAVALVALCGTLSIVLLPALGAFLDDAAFGRWAGAAVHDVGQVVATASTRSELALQAAIAVKLVRVALLAPVVLALSLRARRSGLHADGTRPPVLPAFVVAFLVFAALNSTGLVPSAAVGVAVSASKLLMAMGLAALGLQVHWNDLRRVGGRPLLLGLLAWALVASVALLVVAR